VTWASQRLSLGLRPGSLSGFNFEETEKSMFAHIRSAGGGTCHPVTRVPNKAGKKAGKVFTARC